MTDMNVNTLVGIVLKNDNIKVVEIESTSDDQFRINRITEERLDRPFTMETIRDGSYISDFSEKIVSIAEAQGFNLQNTALTIPNEMLVVKKYPYDLDLTDEEIIDQVDWEVKQFSYSPDDAYVIDFGKLERSRAMDCNELVVVAVRETVVRFIKEVFDKANIRLRIVDAEVFAAIRAINKNYEARDGDTTALVNIEQEAIQFIIMSSGEFFASYHVHLQLKSDATEEEKSETIVKMTSKELKRIIIDHKLGEKIEDLSRIFLFGDLVLDPVLETLQNSYNVRIDRANPFRRLRFAPNVSVDEYIWSRPETFTICVGGALR